MRFQSRVWVCVCVRVSIFGAFSLTCKECRPMEWRLSFGMRIAESERSTERGRERDYTNVNSLSRNAIQKFVYLCTYVCITYLLLVPHGSLAAHHYLAASLLLQLFGRHATRSQNATNKVELKVELGKNKHTGNEQQLNNTRIIHIYELYNKLERCLNSKLMMIWWI